ncbi:MAG: outer membrane beta-barrel protein [Enterovibrio sp.]
MKKILALAVALGMSASALASEEEIMQRDKSGHTFHVGVSRLQGDLADAAKEAFGSDVSKDALFSVGYDYTTKRGIILGAYYMPRMLSESMDVTNGSLSMGDTIKSQVIGLYTGYQFDNNIRLTGGAAFTYTKEDYYEIDSVLGGYEETTKETVVGLMLGLDYLIAEKLLIGARVSAHEYDNLSATLVGINLGYKF